MMLCVKISIYFCNENIIISVTDIQLLLHLLARQGNLKAGNFNHMNVCVCLCVQLSKDTHIHTQI